MEVLKKKVTKKKVSKKEVTSISIPLRAITGYEAFDDGTYLVYTVDERQYLLEGDTAASFLAIKKHSLGPELIVKPGAKQR